MLVVCFLLFQNCSSVYDENENVPKSTQFEITTTFSELEFQNELDNLSEIIITTRTETLNEDLAIKAITPFVKDGEFVRDQLLDDNSLNELETELIENLSDEELAMLSVCANSYARPTNPSLHCLGEALVGGGSITGGITVGFIKKVGVRTALRLVCSALGGAVGGAITAAMIINDYNTCMNNYGR